MHRALTLALCLGAASDAWAGSLVVWMADAVPDEKAIERVEKETGAAAHFAHLQLAFEPTPVTAEDDARYDALRDALIAGKNRWDVFDAELQIAVDLEGAAHLIDVVRDKRDLGLLVDARLFEGAAAQRAFRPREFNEADEAAPFRVQLPGLRVNAPWLEAIALDPTRSFTRTDLADGATWPELEVLQDKVRAVPDGALDLSELPVGTQLVVDGRPVPLGTATLPLRPGTHFAHAEVDGVVSGRQRFDVAPGESVRPRLLVSADELAQARVQVLDGTTTGFPEDVKTGIDALMREHKGPVFVAAVDEGKVEVLPYARDARLQKLRRVTVVGSAEGGGGITKATVFDGQVGQSATVPTAMGGFGVEVGVYNAAVLVGADLNIMLRNFSARAPGATVAEPKNLSLPLGGSVYGGLGAYVLRPNRDRVTLLAAGTFGWTYPAWWTYGGRLVLGIPLGDGSWVRVTGGVNYAPDLWDYSSTPDDPTYPTWRSWYDHEAPTGADPSYFQGFGRVGVSRRF